MPSQYPRHSLSRTRARLTMLRLVALRRWPIQEVSELVDKVPDHPIARRINAYRDGHTLPRTGDLRLSTVDVANPGTVLVHEIANVLHDRA